MQHRRNDHSRESEIPLSLLEAGGIALTYDAFPDDMGLEPQRDVVDLCEDLEQAAVSAEPGLWHPDHRAARHIVAQSQEYLVAQRKMAAPPRILGEAAAFDVENDICPDPADVDRLAEKLTEMAQRRGCNHVHRRLVVVHDGTLSAQLQLLA